MNQAKPPRRHLEIIHPDSAGIDIGSREIWVSVSADRAGETVGKFGVFTDDLHKIRDWLIRERVVTVAMESTGIYWIPLYDVLSAAGLHVCLVNPRELKQVPGRKSDLKDCQWLQELHAFGLLRASFRPDDNACIVRSLVRQRQELVDSSARQVQLLQKALTQMNIRLTEVVSDITGKTGMAIIRSIIDGIRDPAVLAQHRDHRCKSAEDTIRRALTGTWRSEHLLSLKQTLVIYDTYQRLITDTEREIEIAVSRRSVKSGGDAPPNTPPQKSGEHKKRNSSDYHLPISDAWTRASGVDLTEIDGISDTTASIVLAEVGLNIDRFSTSRHFSSWLGLSPAHDISGGKILRRGTRATNNRVARALRLAAHAAGRTQTALGAFYRRIAGRAGKPVAITATARKLAVIVWTMLTKGAEYSRKSAIEGEARFRLNRIKSVLKQAKKLGIQLTAPPELAGS